MKRLLSAFALTALLVGASGCITVRENRLVDGSLAVEIEDNGWYVFGCLPIVSGNPDGSWPHWFRNDVNPEKTMAVLDRILARERPTKVGPIVTREVDENILVVITRVSYRTSAIIYPAEKD